MSISNGVVTFQSGFGPNVGVGVFPASDGNHRAILTGKDETTGNVWYDNNTGTSELPGFATSSIRFQVSTGQRLTDYALCQVRADAGRSGGYGLYTEVIQSDENASNPPTRVRLQIYADSGYQPSEIYSSVYLKLQENLASVQDSTAPWRSLWVLANTGRTKVVDFQVVRTTGNPFWRAIAKPGVEADPAATIDETTTAVPLGTYFRLEAKWTPTGGVQFKVDGTEIIDSPAYVDDFFEWIPWSLYCAATEATPPRIVYQSVDDLVLKMGPGAIPSDW